MTPQETVHSRLVREIAEDYNRKGYYVQIEPTSEQLPDFLKPYRPDMLVKTPEGTLVIEVKSRFASRTSENKRLEDLKQAVEAQPGWSFYLIVDRVREEELLGTVLPVYSEDEIKDRLKAGRQLAEQGILDSALVVGWTALEAALRTWGRREGLDMPDQGTTPMLTLLLSEGELEREDYDRLMHLYRLRSQAAHGYKTENIDYSAFQQLQELTQRLLHQEQQAAA